MAAKTAHLAFDPGALRLRLARLAGAVAETEDDVADTYDQLAQTRPRDAVRLRACADHARQYAQAERDRAAEYSADPAWYFQRGDDA